MTALKRISVQLIAVVSIMLVVMWLLMAFQDFYLGSVETDSFLSGHQNKTALTPKELQRQARREQQFFCDRFHPIPMPESPQDVMRFTPLKTANYGLENTDVVTPVEGIYVIGKNDIVSERIIKYGTFTDENSVMTYVVQNLQLARKDYGIMDPLFLDIGSNLGVFSVLAAAYGLRTVSVEAMRSNGIHYRSTLCHNSALMKKVTFFNMGLGTQPGECVVISLATNRANGIVKCDPEWVQAFKSANEYKGHIFRHFLEVHPLDTMLDEDVWMLKIDVEGFELEVFRGAMNLLTKRKVYYIASEINDEAASMDTIKKYLRFLVSEMGYTCTWGLTGESALNIDNPPWGLNQMFCKHEGHLNALKKILH